MDKEICYIMLGKRWGRFYFGRLVKKTIGDSNSVKFDGDWVLDREEKKGDIIGFWHTHGIDIQPSSRDIKTMLAWIHCFGKQLVCIIQTKNYRASYLCAVYKMNSQMEENYLKIDSNLSNETVEKLKDKWKAINIGQKKAYLSSIVIDKELCAWQFFSKLFRLNNLFLGIR